MTLTPERLAGIRDRVDATPRGPWHTEYFGDAGYPQRIANDAAILIADTHEGGTGLRPIPEFIAHARTDVPDLLAEVDRLTAENGRARALHSEYKIYDECGHNHRYSEDGDLEPGVIEVEDVGLTCEDGLQYVICRECCTHGGRQGQTVTCVDDHDHGVCWPCPTLQALGGKP
jgi:hypothetical protein